MKRFCLIITIFCLLLTAFGCAKSVKLETPTDTLGAYVNAIRDKDAATMRSLLSEGSLKMADDEAKAQKVSLDDIVLRETLFAPDQRVLEHRNEKINGDRATVEIKNSFGSFDIVPFAKENGVWKIAKEKYAEEMIRQADEESRKMDEQINGTSRIPAPPAPSISTMPEANRRIIIEQPENAPPPIIMYSNSNSAANKTANQANSQNKMIAAPSPVVKNP